VRMLHYVQDVSIYLTNKPVPYLHYKQDWCCIYRSDVTNRESQDSTRVVALIKKKKM